MVAPDLGIGFVTALRVGTMLVFIAVFVGIAVWLLTPSGRRRTADQGLRALGDDDDSGDARRRGGAEDPR